jgi:hypothetical protein
VHDGYIRQATWTQTLKNDAFCITQLFRLQEIYPARCLNHPVTPSSASFPCRTFVLILPTLCSLKYVQSIKPASGALTRAARKKQDLPLFFFTLGPFFGINELFGQ